MKALQHFIKGDMHGIHYAVSISIATAVLWFLVHELAERDPIWAISSMVATSDPLMKQAVLTFRARIINSLVVFQSADRQDTIRKRRAVNQH